MIIFLLGMIVGGSFGVFMFSLLTSKTKNIQAEGESQNDRP